MIADSEFLNASILIVDDQEANTQLLKAILKQKGYQNVQITNDPLTVCDMHAANHYDLILLDLQMPVMDGFEVMEGLKKLALDDYLPVLVITAQPAHKLRALQAGAKDFVSKPFDIVEVQSRIRNMLEVRLLYTRLANSNQILEQTVLERTAELRASEARFKSYTELSTDWYWEQDTQGKFTQVSGAVHEMLGIDSSQTLGETTAAFNEHWNTAEKIQLNEYIANRQPFLDFYYSHTDAAGTRRHIQVSGEPIFDQASRFKGYRGIGTNVTQRMRPFDGLIRLRDAVNALPVGILIVSADTLQVLWANAAVCKNTGFTAVELVANASDLLGIKQSGGSASQLSNVVEALLNDDLSSAAGVQQPLTLLRKDDTRCNGVISWYALPIGAQDDEVRARSIVGLVTFQI